MSKTYDVIVVGARCAGSPVAMLLARQGYDVLVVDKATFPSDTMSTHLVHPTGIAALDRWGLLQELVATGCPPIHTYAFDFGPVTISGSPGTAMHPVSYCPRRTVLDKLLVDGAVIAGAELREGFTVDDVVVEDGRVVGIRGHAKGGASSVDRAKVVIGADGRHSTIAELVAAEEYHQADDILCGYYTYWSGLPTDGRFETYVRPDRGWAVMPTHDDLTLVVAGWPIAEFEANRVDVEGNYMKTFELEPRFLERLHDARREARVVGTHVRNYFRKPFGPGWALVGDAGYNKDFITAQGISDAFRDAEVCAEGLDAALSGALAFDEAMSRYQRARDEHVLPMYELTKQLATLEPPPADLQQLIGAMAGQQEPMDAFCRVQAGVTSPAEFFAPDNVESIFAAANAMAT
jgi:flavin-dependent dehydrogenase